MPPAPSTTAVSTTTAIRTRDIILALLVPATPVFAACIFAAAPDALTPQLALLAFVKECSDRVGRTLSAGTADHAGIPNGPVAQRLQ